MPHIRFPTEEERVNIVRLLKDREANMSMSTIGKRFRRSMHFIAKVNREERIRNYINKTEWIPFE